MITAAELLHGVARLPCGRRKGTLDAAVRSVLWEDFAGRIEPFDTIVADVYALLVSERERAGRPIGVADAQIAAICRTRGAALATRNTADFAGTGVERHNPWQTG